MNIDLNVASKIANHVFAQTIESLVETGYLSQAMADEYCKTRTLRTDVGVHFSIIREDK